MNYIVIVDIGESKYSKYCIDSWKQWSRKYNIEVVVIDDSLKLDGNIEPHWYKSLVPNIFIESSIPFDKIAIVDNDTIVNPKCPNFFELVSKYEIGVCLDDTNYDWIIRSMELYKKYVFKDFKDYSPFEYFNSGFMIVDNYHKDLFNSIKEFVVANYKSLQDVQSKYGVGRDQTALNYIIRYLIDTIYPDIQLKFMDVKYNVQGITQKEIFSFDILDAFSHVTHFNAMSREDRLILMQQVYSKYYE
jgi:hypothetical protein